MRHVLQWQNVKLSSVVLQYPLVNKQFGPVEIVDLPTKNGGSSHSYVNVYQRVDETLKKELLGTFVGQH